MNNDFSTEQSGMEDYPEHKGWTSEGIKICINIEHNPPNFIRVPQGKRYRHVCPTCGAVQYIYPSMIYCQS